MRLQAKVIIASAVMLLISTLGLGGLTIAIVYQQGVANLRKDLSELLNPISQNQDPLSAALFELAYADVNISFQQDDGTTTVLQQSYESSNGAGEVKKVLDLGYGEKLIVSSSTREIENLVADLVPLIFLSAGVFSLLSGVVLFSVLSNDVRGIRDLAKFAETRATDKAVEYTPRKTSREISQLSKALVTTFQRLDANERNLRDFLSDSSHELKTPLTVIRGYLEILIRDSSLAKARDHLSKAHREALRMQRLVGDLLLLSEIESPEALTITEFNLARVIEDELAAQEPLSADKEFTSKVPQDLTIRADQHLVSRLISNAISNIRIHTPSGTRAIISSEVLDSEIQLNIEDSGPGLPRGIAEAPGTRFNSSRSPNGTGLGLSIMESIVRKHGGVIEFCPSELGGLRVSAHFPAAAS